MYLDLTPDFRPVVSRSCLRAGLVGPLGPVPLSPTLTLRSLPPLCVQDASAGWIAAEVIREDDTQLVVRLGEHCAPFPTCAHAHTHPPASLITNPPTTL